MGEAAALLPELVRIPSPSGREEAVARSLEAWARDRGLEVTRDETAVALRVRGRGEGPLLLLASHLDTVPPGEGWTVDPWEGVVRDGLLTGRGAVDAKASVAAMAAAAALLAASGGPSRGELVVLATYGEETRDTTMPEALRRLGRVPDAAVVGEPTGLEPAVAQRGLVIAEVRWRGRQVHAGWAASLPGPPANAITAAARDLARLEGTLPGGDHPLLGPVTVTPTMLRAGVARNVTPPACTAILDVRTTPALDHAGVVAALRERLDGEVSVLSDRLEPAETPEGSALLAALGRVAPGLRPFGSPTASDWVWLRHVDALKLGPGDSRQSHRPDETVALAEVDRGAGLYAALAGEYLR